MDTDFLIGPMIERLPTHEVGILHGAEGSLHMMLTAVRQNDLLGRELVVVGEQNSSSEGAGDELLQGVRIRVVVHLELSSPPHGIFPQDARDVMAGGRVLGV